MSPKRKLASFWFGFDSEPHLIVVGIKGRINCSAPQILVHENESITLESQALRALKKVIWEAWNLQSQTRDTMQEHHICEMLGSTGEPSCHSGMTDYSQKPFLVHKEQAGVVCPSPKPAS